jgi:hypothetical protein
MQFWTVIATPPKAANPGTKSDFLMFERWWLSLARGFESEGQDQ